MSDFYSKYVKKLASFIFERKVFQLDPTKLKASIKGALLDQVLVDYERARELIEIITTKVISLLKTQIFPLSIFCVKYRFYKNLLKLVYIDLVRLYRIAFTCVAERMLTFDKLSVDQLKQLHKIAENFVSLSEATEKSVKGMLSLLNEPVTIVITFFKVNMFSDNPQPSPDFLKNIKDFIAAQEEEEKLQEESKSKASVYATLPIRYDAGEEFDLGEGKEDVFNIGEGDLTEFMTQTKKEKELPAYSPPMASSEEYQYPPQGKYEDPNAYTHMGKDKEESYNISGPGAEETQLASEKQKENVFDELFNNATVQPAYATSTPSPAYPSAYVKPPSQVRPPPSVSSYIPPTAPPKPTFDTSGNIWD